MDVQLEASYALCRQVTRRSASSFSWSFYLLSVERRRAMEALYAFLRRTDDLVDGNRPLAVRRAALRQWRQSLDAARYHPDTVSGLWLALLDTVDGYGIPFDVLYAAVEGAAMDLDVATYATFEQLQAYCDCVATAVGKACLHIWGAPEMAASDAARACGQAIQLTNILRDVREDALLGRVYLPQADLQRYGCDIAMLQGDGSNPAFRALMEFEIERVERLYEQAQPLHQLQGEGRAIVRAILRTYQSLLARIKSAPDRVLRMRVRVPHWQRIWIVGSESMAHRWHAHSTHWGSWNST